MIISAALICVILALVAFLLDAFRVPAGVSWTPLAWAFLCAAILFGLR